MSIGPSFRVLLWMLTAALPAAVRADAAESMYGEAAALSKLAAAVQATVYRGFPDDLSEEVLLYVATRHDPRLLEAFGAYALRARREGRETSVMLCTADRSRRLLEDAGCTGRVDRHFWRDTVAAGCDFEKPLADLCGVAAAH